MHRFLALGWLWPILLDALLAHSLKPYDPRRESLLQVRFTSNSSSLCAGSRAYWSFTALSNRILNCFCHRLSYRIRGSFSHNVDSCRRRLRICAFFLGTYALICAVF